MGIIHIFSNGMDHTTARYFERVVATDTNTSVVYWDRCPELDYLKKEDVLVFIDPAPDWPIGIELVPCLTIAYFIDVHQDLSSRLQMSQFFDAVFVAQKDYVISFVEFGHDHAYWLPLACDPKVHHVPAERRIYDVGFVGKLGLQGSPRNKILTSVLPCYRTNDYMRFYSPSEMAKVYGQAKIVFNASINGDVNMRIYEAMAAGSLLVTDRIENGFAELFEEGVHYVGYSSLEEAIEKINFYLANVAERSQIASEGQRIVFEQHTYRHRWDEIKRLSTSQCGKAQVRGYSHRELSELYSNVFVSLRMPKRILVVIGRYGLGKAVMRNLLISYGRWLNARIPLTPNAIRARLRIG